MDEWKNNARCKYFPEVDFFVERVKGTRNEDDPRLKAKEVCSTCPVKAECLAYALRNNEQFGVWGGTTSGERRKMRGFKRYRFDKDSA